MKCLEIQLKAAGATWSDVVYQRIFMVDGPNTPNWADEPLPVYVEGFRPPGAAIGVTRLGHLDFLVEIDLLAVVPATGETEPE